MVDLLQIQIGGYAATTVPDVATAAGVAVKTVYASFPTKSALLHAVWDYGLKAQDDQIPVAQRDWYRQVLEERDAARQLALNARNSRRAKERIGKLLEVIRSAASLDDGVHELWQTIEREYHANQRVIIESINAKKALKPGLSVDRATDVLWTINHPSTWQCLVAVRGWSPDAYEAWAREAACQQLLS